MVIRERLVYARLPVSIDWYGYEVWRGEEKLYWYDSQPHPDDKSLQSTEPHHKHLPPDIKHHRVPAPGMSFSTPNLPAIIAEVIELVEDAPHHNTFANAVIPAKAGIHSYADDCQPGE